MNVSLISRNEEKLEDIDLSCEIHPKGEMNMVCLEEDCPLKGLTCRYCITESHLKHSNKCLPVDSFLKNVYTIRRQLKKNLVENYFKDSVEKLQEVLFDLFSISEELNKLVINKREELEDEGKRFKITFNEKFKRFDDLYKNCLNNRKSMDNFRPSLQNIIELVDVDDDSKLTVNLFNDLEDRIKVYFTKMDMVFKNSRSITENIRKSFTSIALIDDVAEKKTKRRNSSSHQTTEEHSEKESVNESEGSLRNISSDLYERNSNLVNRNSIQESYKSATKRIFQDYLNHKGTMTAFQK